MFIILHISVANAMQCNCINFSFLRHIKGKLETRNILLYFPLAVTAFGSARFGRGQGPIWLDDLRCFRNDSSLLSCGHNEVGVHDCDHGEDAGVICAFGNYIACIPSMCACMNIDHSIIHTVFILTFPVYICM